MSHIDYVALAAVCGELSVTLRQLLGTVDHLIAIRPRPTMRELVDHLNGMRGAIVAALARAEAA